MMEKEIQRGTIGREVSPTMYVIMYVCICSWVGTSGLTGFTPTANVNFHEGQNCQNGKLPFHKS